MKFGEEIEYNLSNIFLEESYTKCGVGTISRSFFKKSKLSISLDQYSKALYIWFLLVFKLQSTSIYIKKAFLKIKKWSGTILPASFLHDF